MEKKIIHFSRFVPVTDLGGGARRTRQVVKLLQPFHPEMISTWRGERIHDLSPEKLGFRNTTGLKYYRGRDGELKYWSTFDLTAISTRGKRRTSAVNKIRDFFINKNGDKPWSSKHKQKVNRLQAISGEWARQLDPARLRLALVDDPIYFLPLTKKLKEIGIPVVAVSHNIESLASHQVTRRYQIDLFQREIDVLTGCDLVVTISREETWLLKNLNINALFLPYYPVDEILNRMLTIRKNRGTTEKRDFLLIGTTINAATRQGMFAVIDHWKRAELSREGDRLLVAGFMSDIFLKDIKNEKNIEILGPVPDEELDKLMSTARACIVYQEWGSGALTRIMETLAAGVPVLVNTHAARSYFNMKGVIEFHDLFDLERTLGQANRLEEPVPLPAQPDVSHIISSIKKLI